MRNNIIKDEVAVPLEYSYFIEDAEKDTKIPNRYWFKYPAEWVTSDIGEPIVGIRSMFMLKQIEDITFRFECEKLNKKTGKINRLIIDCYIVLTRDVDIQTFCKELNNKCVTVVKENNKEIDSKETTEGSGKYPRFKSSIIFAHVSDSRDSLLYIFNEMTNGDDSNIEITNISFKINKSFKNILGIPSNEEPLFAKGYKVWNRNTCKVYSSIASMSNRSYLCNTSVYFNPIRYYKLNSTDQKFWIEFYDVIGYNIPVVLPLGVGFVLEMIFLRNKKLLYI